MRHFKRRKQRTGPRWRRREERAAQAGLRLEPSGPLRGEISVPGDKSIAHRALILASLAEGSCRIEGLPAGGDVLATARCLAQLGVSFAKEGQAIVVGGVGLGGLRPAERPLDCENSGTTMRLLAGVLAGSGVGGILDGDDGLRKRPMRRVLSPLRQMGADCWGMRDLQGDERAPLRFERGAWLSGRAHVLAVASAQVKSAILLAGLWADGATTVQEPALSRDHTERMLAAFGAPIERLGGPTGHGLSETPGAKGALSDTLGGHDALSSPPGAEDALSSLPGAQNGLGARLPSNTAGPSTTPGDAPRIPASRPAPLVRITRLTHPLRAPAELHVPGDPSSAAFLIAAALLRPGSHVRIPGVCTNPTRLGFWQVLLRMGADVALEPGPDAGGEPTGTLIARGGGRLQATDISPEEIPALIDEVPILAVLATAAHGTTRICGAGELRVKESDRLASMARELRKMGAHVRETADGLEIDGPTPLAGAALEAHGDHRIAMSLAVAALSAQSASTLAGAEWADVSFPGFFEALRVLTSRA